MRSLESSALADRSIDTEVVPADHPQPVARLLIVDDVKDNRTVLGRRFARRGFEIVEADGGRCALDLIGQQSFDAVLLDIMMPEVDGIEVLTTVRRRFSPEQLPVIMVTAKAEPEHIVEALKLGANDYVTKPVNFDFALARINAQIERKRSEMRARAASLALQHANQELEQHAHRLVEINGRLQGEIELRQEVEAHSVFLALHDPLTNLPNRRHFHESLAAVLADSRADTARVQGVLFVDLDGFKSVNNTLGNTVGDLLLQAIARDFCAELRRSDQIARLGGDEFAILLVDVADPHDAVALAIRLIEVAGRERFIQGHHVTVGASIGIAIDSSRADAEDLLKSADLAMCRAKLEGRGTYRIFDPAMDAHVQVRRSLELDLRNALQLGQFEVHYQPQVTLNPRRVTGFEALLRWRHPKRGMVSPADFIPLAEEMGLIVPIGEWVLHEACSEAVGWPGGQSIAVNVSSVQFTRGSLVEAVSGALAASGLAANRLEIEVTESVLLRKTERNLETLNQLRALGVRISMDDFGTGHSSLSYLKMFKFDKLKIDKSFIENVISDNESKLLIKAILGLGRSFEIDTIAEGVETEEQLLFLASEGCVDIQGYIFGAAMKPGDILHFVEQKFL